MEPDKNTPKDADKVAAEKQNTPADALSLTPDELRQEAAETAVDSPTPASSTEKKKVSPIKRFLRAVNVYLLAFVLLLVVAGIVTVVYYLNSQKAPEEPDVASQGLTQDALKQLANTDATVGNTSQTLTIQGNAVISGQTLTRGDLNVAGNFQTGGTIQGPSLTVSGATNLGDTQINTLQVASNTAIQGSTTMRDLNVAGTSTFSGAMTASQITVSRLILSGNATLEIPNHISFTGPTPKRDITSSTLGSGGSASISGSDTAGIVSINTGNNPQPGCFIQITFAQAFSRQPRVIISPVGAGAGQTQYYVNRSTTSFSICTVNAAPANQSFAFDYFITY
ncbi:MAG: hypothetical protein ACSLEY_00390 [Candidatus Saccharimonadales bacterium]